MSDDEPERLDAPNQQVVRPDASAPWDEGEGGTRSEDEESQEDAGDEEKPKPKARKASK